MRRVFILFVFCLVPFSVGAQNWDFVKADTRTYISGEGWGETIEEADKQALAAIISKISVLVSSNFEQLEGEKTTADGQEYERYIESKINTFSNATLTNTESVIISNEPDAHVGRWIRRSEIDRIFEGRKAKVLEYVGNAEKAEKKGKVDDALRNYYWAYTMLKTLQHPSEMAYVAADGEPHTLVSWIPAQMDDIFDEIKPSVVAKKGNDVELFFKYKGNPVTSLDYTYFDGSHWSNIYSAKDGKGVLELAPGAPGEHLQLKYEYAYRNEAHIDRELYDVINAVKGNSMKGSYVTIGSDVSSSAAAQAVRMEKNVMERATKSLMKLDGERYYKTVMDRIVSAIRTKDYSSVDAFFTEEGLDMYHRLVKYGNASLVGEPVCKIYQYEDKVVVRSVPMSFSFTKGLRKAFVEDIVFTFNPEGKVECLAFSLDKVAAADILDKQVWPDNARMAIIEFLENYKTAFALERLDYIRTIFDDNAVIIVGNVARAAGPVQSSDGYDLSVGNNTVVTRTRYNKEQYLKNLERCFESNEFVNIRFANNDVIKAGKGGEIYGIQIKQDYYSTNYGDTGYLFLLVDINQPKEPLIKVRTWQPEPDPIDGLFDLSHF